MEKANHSILDAKFKLKQLVDSGDFHTELRQSLPHKFLINSMIPVVFKLDLRNYLSPLRVFIQYHPIEVVKDHQGTQIESNVLNDNSLIYGSFKNP